MRTSSLWIGTKELYLILAVGLSVPVVEKRPFCGMANIDSGATPSVAMLYAPLPQPFHMPSIAVEHDLYTGRLPPSLACPGVANCCVESA